MKCAQLKLAERKTARRRKHCQDANLEHPIRYCQLKQVNPQYEEDPNWKSAALKRFHLTSSNSIEQAEYVNSTSKQNKEDTNMNKLFLTVLNLNFPTPTRSSRGSLNYRNKFKFRMYPKSTEKCYHRMFVKEVLDKGDLECDNIELTSSVQLDYKFDKYLKTILTTDENSTALSPVSVLSSLNNKFSTETNENIDGAEVFEPDLQDFSCEIDMNKKPYDYVTNNITREETDEESNNVIKLRTLIRRKSIPISRTQSPETLQVIRVDVMCNYSKESSLISKLGDDQSLSNDIVDSIDIIKTKTLQKINMQRRNNLRADNEQLAIYCKSLKYNERPVSRTSTNAPTSGIKYIP